VIVLPETELRSSSGKTVPPALLALVAPDVGMERQARTGGVWPWVLIAMVCSVLFGVAQAVRIDARAATLKKLESSGQLQNMSDKQVDDETKNAERLYQVGRVSGGLVDAPLSLGLSCLAVVGLTWFLRGRVKGAWVVPVAAATLLPGAIANLLGAAAAFQHAALAPNQPTPLAPRSVSALFALFDHPLSGPWLKLGNAFDFFSLWAAVMMAFGVAATGGIPARRALIGTLVAWVCLRLLTNVAVGG
jgi:hypothetical protein